MTQPPHTAAPGTVFGQYQVVRLIGEGGMGAVFEAIHTNLKKRVALKTLTAAGAMNSEALARFLREGEMAAKIRHPNVVDITDFGVHEGTPYLVMELLEGENLAARIGRGALGITEAVDLLFPVLAAVQTAHEEGVIHRDLKPQNIFLARGRHGQVSVKLLDFGISKVTDPAKAGPELTHTQSMLGTPFYMSPEQVRGAKLLDAKTDQYSLGVIFYECVTGRVPFYHDQLFSLLTMITQGVYPAPSTLRSDVPPQFEQVVARAMHIDKDARFASVAELGSALLPLSGPGAQAQWGPVFAHQGLVTGVTLEPTVSATHPPATAQPSVHAHTNASLSTTNSAKSGASRGARIAVGVAAVVGLGVAATVLMMASRTPPEPEPEAGAPVKASATVASSPPPAVTVEVAPSALAPSLDTSAPPAATPEPKASATSPTSRGPKAAAGSSRPRATAAAATPASTAPAAASAPKRTANQAPILR